MARHANLPRIDLPRGWPRHVESAMLHVVALGRHAMAYTRIWAVNGRIARLRLKAENDLLRQQAGVLAEEIRVDDARLRRIDPQRLPHYVATERMAILEPRDDLHAVDRPKCVSSRLMRRCHVKGIPVAVDYSDHAYPGTSFVSIGSPRLKPPLIEQTR